MNTAHVIPNPRPDRAQAERFLTWLDEAATSFTFQTFDDLKQRKDQSLARILHGTLDQHAVDLERLQWRRAGVYVTINATDGRGRKLGNMVRPRAIWCEWDHCGEALPQWPLDPQVVVESSPGKYHCYWFAGDLEWADFDQLMQVMVAWGSDKNAKDRSRVLRLPGFWHQKHEQAFQVRMVAENERMPYSREELLGAFPVTSAPAETVAAPPVPDGDHGRWASKIIRLAAEHGARTHADPQAGRNAQVMSLGHELQSHGVPETEDYDTLALKTFESTMRPTNTAGEACGLNWENEWRALKHGRATARRSPTVIHGAQVAEALLKNQARNAAQAVPDADEAPLWQGYLDEQDADLPTACLEIPFGCGPDLVRYLLESSLHPNPVFAVQTARAFLAAVLSRRHVSSQRNFANLFTVLIGKTAIGKEDSKHQLENLLTACGLERMLIGKGYSHPSAIYSALQDEPKHVALIDEMGMYLREQKNTNSSINLLLREFMELYGRAHGLHHAPRLSALGLSKADRDTAKSGRLPIVKPALNLVAMSTPETFWGAMARDHLDNGFLNRFLLVESYAPRAVMADFRAVPIPESVVEWARWATGADNPLTYAQQFTYDLEPPLILWTLTPQAKAAAREFEQRMLDWADAWNLELPGLGNLVLRANENSLRVALQNAALDGDADFEVTDRHLLDAQQYVETHTRRAGASLRRHWVATPFEANRNIVLEAIRGKGEKGITEYEMARSAPFTRFNEKELRELLDSLAKGWLIAFLNVRDGKPGRKREAWTALDPEKTAKYCEGDFT